jgi:hypothetical protein
MFNGHYRRFNTGMDIKFAQNGFDMQFDGAV